MSAEASDQPGGRVAPPGDGGRAVTMMLLFTAAIMLVVGAIWALTAVGGWWMLAAAMAIHLAVTTIVLIEVVRVIGGRSHARRGPTKTHPTR
jgi:hypothetical protein